MRVQAGSRPERGIQQQACVLAAAWRRRFHLCFDLSKALTTDLIIISEALIMTNLTDNGGGILRGCTKNDLFQLSMASVFCAGTRNFECWGSSPPAGSDSPGVVTPTNCIPPAPFLHSCSPSDCTTTTQRVGTTRLRCGAACTHRTSPRVVLLHSSSEEACRV